AREAVRRRVHAIGSALHGWRLLQVAMRAGGGWRAERVTPCSLVQRTGPRREMAVVRVDRMELRAAAHAVGATTNDAILVAVAAALAQVLELRAETVDPILITVPVSG